MAITTSLDGKTAVITGSNSGIGLGIAWELARAGANVVLNSFTDRPEDHALAAEIAPSTGVNARYIQADMSKGEDCRALIAKAARACDILVNNAGIQHVAPIDELPAGTVGPDHRDQPHLRLPHERRRPAGDAREGLGPDHRRGLGPRAHRLALQVGLCRLEARPWSGFTKVLRARDGGAGDHRERDLPGLCADTARRGADPRPDEDRTTWTARRWCAR